MRAQSECVWCGRVTDGLMWCLTCGHPRSWTRPCAHLEPCACVVPMGRVRGGAVLPFAVSDGGARDGEAAWR
jgi:hypothetical protein